MIWEVSFPPFGPVRDLAVGRRVLAAEDAELRCVLPRGNGSHMRVTSIAFGRTTSGTMNVPITFSAEAGATRAGIRAGLCERVTLRSNRADQNGRWGILTGFCDDLLIENDECSNSGIEHGIYVSNSGDRPIVRGHCHFGNDTNGLHLNRDVNLSGDGIISNALVENDIIRDNGSADGSGIRGDGVQDWMIRNDLLFEKHASGISSDQIEDAGSASGNTINRADTSPALEIGTTTDAPLTDFEEHERPRGADVHPNGDSGSAVDEGCGCESTRANQSLPTWWLLALVAVFALRSRSRREGAR